MIRVKGHWRGFPGHWLEGGKRFVATDYGWRRITGEGARTVRFCEASDHAEGCGRIGVEWHHRRGRGGGKRDDRIEFADGTRNMYWLSRACHDVARIERKSAEFHGLRDTTTPGIDASVYSEGLE